jgi:hypothetical protein
MKTKGLVALVAAVVFTMMLVSANLLANGITDWDIGLGGTVSFDGASTLSGSGIPVSMVVGAGTPLNAGAQLSLSGATLSFSDSNYLGNWGWGSGGTLNVSGASGTLLSDDFQSVTVADLGGTSFQLTFGQVQGSIASSVASYFGISGSFAASSLQLTLAGSGSLPYSAFSSTNMGGTINAQDPAVSATEHWNLAMSLIFFGLVAAIFSLLVEAKILRVTRWA